MPSGAGSPRAVWVCFALLLALASTPVFSTVLPPLVDYPNHLARMHLLGEGGNAYYAVRWAPLPDLAADLIVPALARVVPLALAGKLFLVAIFALLGGGALWLNRAATGEWRVWPLLAFALLYNRSFLWGFLNYLFGLGVALCGLALWLALERRVAWLRAAVSTAVALACFFSHVAAFGVYALALFGIELMPALAELRRGKYAALARRAAVAAPQLLIPAALLLWLVPHAAGDGRIAYGEIWRKADMLFSVFDNYSRPFDIACFVLFLVLLGGLAGSRRLGLDRRLGLAALSVFVAYLLLPNQAFTGSGLDHRLPPAAFLLLLAATWPRDLGRRAALALGAAAVLVLVARFAAIEAVWRRADAVYRADLAAIDLLPRGAKLAVAYPPRAVNAGGVPELHVAALAASRREAFVPTLFAYPTQQPIALRPPYDALAAATSPAALWAAFAGGAAAARARLLPTLREYDFIVFADREPVALPVLPCLAPVPSPPRFRLYRIDRSAACE